MSNGSLIVLSAPSGAGKTTLSHAAIDRLAEAGIVAQFSISYTTRDPRPGEVDGQHYHFVDVPTFERMAADGQMLEHAHVFGRYYGTGKAATEELLAAGTDVFLDIDWQGARQIKALLGEAAISVFICPPSLEELRRRLSGRGQDSDEVIAARMSEAVAEIRHYDEFDYLVVNDDLQRATDELVSLCVTRRLRLEVQRQRHAARLRTLTSGA